MTDFNKLFNKITPDMREVRWLVSNEEVDDALIFFRVKFPNVRYITSESWSEDGMSNITFKWG